ncbi:helix-turn-helix transcriptional regulator [Actinokineospora sp. 24-640]
MEATMAPDEAPDSAVGPAAAELAAEIRRLRISAGLSQKELAAQVGYTRQYVSLAERTGGNLPSLELVRALDARLNADGRLLALRDQARTDQRTLRQAPAAFDDASRPILAGTVVSEVGKQPAVDVEVMVMDAAEESAAFLARVEASNVGDLTVEQLHVDVRRVAAVYLTVPTMPLFARARALRDRTFALLEGRQRPGQARELYAAAGWSLTLLAWMTVDLGRPDIAETHARTAWACADNADHDGLRAWVRATQHTAAFWQDDHERAARFAADGLRYARGTGRTFLASAYALDLARLGHADHARSALVAAQRCAEDAEKYADDVPGPFTCSAERAAGFWSDTALSLGEPAVTAEHADRAVARLDAVPAEQRNPGSERMVRLQQVKARLALGELDGAALALAPVMATPPEHRVRPLLQRLTEARAAAGSFIGEPIADRIRDEIADFTRHPGVPELTV